MGKVARASSLCCKHLRGPGTAFSQTGGETKTVGSPTLCGTAAVMDDHHDANPIQPQTSSARITVFQQDTLHYMILRRTAGFLDLIMLALSVIV